MAAYDTVLRLLMRAFPAEFRDEFGDEMRQTLHNALAACPNRQARLRFVARACVDLFAQGLRERFAPQREELLPVASELSMPLSTQDVRYAFRSLSRRPGLVAAVTITLALGIGANTAVFSLIDSVLLRPLPIAEPERVVAIYQAYNATSPYGRVAYPAFREMQQRSRTLARLAGHTTVDAAVVIGPRATQHTVAAVSGDYFAVLGLAPRAGRLLIPEDDAPGAENVVVLGDALWASEFNRAPEAIGTSIRFGERLYTIVGVAPPGFRGLSLAESPALWVPLTQITQLGVGGLFDPARDVMTTFSFGWVGLVGRLRAEATPEAASHELEGILIALLEDRNQTRALGRDVQRHVTVLPAVEAAALSDRTTLERFILLVLGVVVLTMLIACVNVANLLMVRSHERARELGLRATLGAGRARIAWQLFLESLMLGVAGAAAGLAVAVAAIRLVSGFTLPGGIDLGSVPLGLDSRVLFFTALLGVVTALVFGLVPALRASRVDLASMLRGHGRASRGGPRAALVAIQVAMSILLLVGAGLFARSLRAGLTTDLGFDPAPLAAISMDPGLNGYDAVRTRQYYDAAMEAARRIPGVEAAAVTTQVPLSRLTKLSFTPGNAAPGGEDARVVAGLVSITPDYFRTLGITLRRGRSVRPEEIGIAGLDTTARPVVVNATAAERFWPGQDPIGRHMKLLGSIPLVVVGVADDTKYESVRDGHEPVVFLPLRTDRGVSLVVRSRMPAEVLPALRRAIAALDPNLPLRDARLVSAQLDAVLMPQRFGTTLLGLFSVIALCVAALGIYSVSAYTVSQRTAELGIRIALGAQRRDVMRSVLARTAPAAIAGIAIGLVAAAMTTHLLDPFIFGVTAHDMVAFAAAAGVLGLAAIVAGWVPARRATRIDPVAAMRVE